jgi:hypothetical protein
MSWGVDPSLPVGEARKIYFAKAGFPADGGYASKWVSLPIGPIPFGFPNTDSRRRAVPLHDIHHLATDYPTTWKGEGEISGWELGAGCGRYSFAWFINLQGLVIGWLVDWGATWRAFVRGRHSRSLYREGYSDAVLDESLGTLRSRLELDRPAPAPRPADYLAYASWCAVALIAAGVVLSPVLALVWFLLS